MEATFCLRKWRLSPSLARGFSLTAQTNVTLSQIEIVLRGEYEFLWCFFYQDFGAFSVTTYKKARERVRERHVLLFICSQSRVYFLSSTKSLSRFIKDIFLLSFHIEATPSQNLISFDTSFVFQPKMIMENANRNTHWTYNIYHRFLGVQQHILSSLQSKLYRVIRNYTVLFKKWSGTKRFKFFTICSNVTIKFPFLLYLLYSSARRTTKWKDTHIR